MASARPSPQFEPHDFPLIFQGLIDGFFLTLWMPSVPER